MGEWEGGWGSGREGGGVDEGGWESEQGRVGEWMREGGGVDEEGGGILCGVGR